MAERGVRAADAPEARPRSPAGGAGVSARSAERSAQRTRRRRQAAKSSRRSRRIGKERGALRAADAPEAPGREVRAGGAGVSARSAERSAQRTRSEAAGPAVRSRASVSPPKAVMGLRGLFGRCASRYRAPCMGLRGLFGRCASRYRAPCDAHGRLDNARVREDLRDVLCVLRFLTVGHGEGESVISGSNAAERQHDCVSYESARSFGAPVDAERDSFGVDTGSFVGDSRDRAAVADDMGDDLNGGWRHVVDPDPDRERPRRFGADGVHHDRIRPGGRKERSRARRRAGRSGSDRGW